MIEHESHLIKEAVHGDGDAADVQLATIEGPTRTVQRAARARNTSTRLALASRSAPLRPAS